MPKTLDEVPNLTADERAMLDEFAAAVRDRLGERVRRIELFGSRARGDAGEESDYDVLVVLDRESYDDFVLVSDAAYDLLLRRDMLLVPLVMAEDQWAHQRELDTFLSRDILAEGALL